MAVSDESADRDVGRFAAFGSPSRELGDGDAEPGRRPVGGEQPFVATDGIITFTHIPGMPCTSRIAVDARTIMLRRIETLYRRIRCRIHDIGAGTGRRMPGSASTTVSARKSLFSS